MSFQQDEVIKPFSGSRSQSRRGSDLEAQRRGLSTAPVGATRRRSGPQYNEFISTPPRYPYCFQPENAFQALQDKTQGHKASPKTRGLEKAKKRDYHIPGYTGYVRGSQHIAGRTYGDATRKALTTSYRENVSTSPIPSGPQTNGRVKHEYQPNSFVHKVLGRPYHIPGYTGYVPGVHRQFSKTYGNATTEQLERQNAGRPKTRGDLGNGYARGMKERSYSTLRSAPLPGMNNPVGPPRKLIPSYVGNLSYYGSV